MAGAFAMVVQVLLLMWLRTVMNYQYRHGMNLLDSFRALYAQGGCARLYSGLGPALIQGPLARFADTAANEGVVAFFSVAMGLPVAAATLLGSAAAGCFRLLLVPIDAIKTTMQVDGTHAMTALRARVKAGGVVSLWDGSIAACFAAAVAHYPWFAVHNTLQSLLPEVGRERLALFLLRAGVIGLCSSVVADTCANALRVLKTVAQTHPGRPSYTEVVREILRTDGVSGLLFRGLAVRLVCNMVQAVCFTMIWRYLIAR